MIGFYTIPILKQPANILQPTEDKMKHTANKLLFIPLLLTTCILSACGGDSEEEKSAIDKLTEETASKAVHYIQDPIDKAQNVQVLSNQHSEQIEQAVEAEK